MGKLIVLRGPSINEGSQPDEATIRMAKNYAAQLAEEADRIAEAQKGGGANGNGGQDDKIS